MTERRVIQARAFATSSRPGARSILDGGSADGPPARFWAEPAKLLAAVELLEALGFYVGRPDRTGVGISGWQETFEAAFAVTLTAEEGPDGPIWTATAAGGATPIIAPADDAQRACLRGVLLERPPASYGGPINSVPAAEKALRPEYPYQVMPHQLRTQLSAKLRPSERVDTIPRGKGVKVVVIDSGWNAKAHKYWDQVGLREAADNVILVKDPGYENKRATIKTDLARLKQRLAALRVEIEQATEDKNAIRRTATEQSAELQTIFNRYTKDLDALAGVVPLNLVTGAKKNLIEAKNRWALNAAKQAFLDAMVHDEKKIDEHVKNLGKDMLDDRPSSPHGSEVISQLIGVAPEATIIMVQVGNDEIFPEPFRTWSKYRGFSRIDAWWHGMAKHHPNVISYSLGEPHNYDPNLTDEAEKTAREATLNELDQRLARLKMVNVLAVYCAGNKRDGEPPNVVAQSRSRSENLMIVGGAYWRDRATRDLHASPVAIGYRDGDIAAPFVCGLCGPGQQPGDTNTYFGLSFLPRVGEATPFRALDGTSYSTPQVAGVAAILKGVTTLLSSVDLRSIIADTATAIPDGNGDFTKPQWAESALPENTFDKPGLVDLFAAHGLTQAEAKDKAKNKSHYVSMPQDADWERPAPNAQPGPQP